MVEYELIDHTADIGIKVKGKDLKNLFSNAAKAMFNVIALKPKSIAGLRKKPCQINLKASNREELFVRWLSELLSLSDCKDVYFTDIKINKLTETEIAGTVAGVARRYFQGTREVKAVTYCDVKVAKRKNGFFAQVIFDV